MGETATGRRLRLTGLCLIFAISLPGAGPDVATKDFVLSEYPKALTALEARYANCYGEGILSKSRTQEGGKGAIVRSSKIEFSFSGESGRLLQSASGSAQPKVKAKRPRDHQVVWGYNNKYSFMIVKKEWNSGFLIRWVNDGPQNGHRAVFNGPGLHILCSTMAHQTPVAKILALPGFRLDRLTEIHEPDQPRRLRIEFTIPRRPTPNDRVIQITEGWFVVSPEDRWILHEYGTINTVPTGRDTTHVGHVVYERGSGGEPQPVKSEFKWYLGRFTSDPAVSDPSVLPHSGEQFEFTKLQFGATPDREFTLSAFGLPEFDQPVPRRFAPSYPWWIFGAAVVATVVALVLRRLSTRRDAARDRQAG